MSVVVIGGQLIQREMNGTQKEHGKPNMNVDNFPIPGFPMGFPHFCVRVPKGITLYYMIWVWINTY